ncbi:MAG TPA: HEPN domain-containing protein [Sedimentisphaerales bacterium]|nr:HEPN domain-containing protein [Sedimentisphaerales bacterium]HRS09725.1 HEPN domain-containing protein [Sedimentisphaerales bacterium]HRV46625.1 HEPN domain-containing protein [Sedimentisphaerales bacterium]
MAFDAPPAGSAQDWLRYAASDLALARASGVPDVMLESPCCHAQQCAEKSLKAVPITYGVGIHRTHSIGLLLDLLGERTLVPPEVEEAAILTDYAVASRYPGDTEPITQSDYEKAVHLAETVFAWARQLVR